MPSRNKVLIAIRGTRSYAEYLARLEQTVRTAGCEIDRVGSGRGPNALAEYALADLGRRYGLHVPERASPLGTNQYGPPDWVRSDRKSEIFVDQS